MKYIFTFITFSLLTTYLCGQKTIDTLYFDSKWKKTDKENCSYFRILVRQADNRFKCSDYWKTGEIQMTGAYSSLNPDIREGEFTYYYKNGNNKEISNYENNKPVALTRLFKEDGTFDLACAGDLEMLDNIKEINIAITDFISFTRKKIRYPETSRKNGVEGKVLVAFFINQNGIPYRIAIAQSVNEEIDNEAIRIIKLFKWPSPVYKGEKTMILVALPVTFTLL
jgi:periplasmic protein TonB